MKKNYSKDVRRPEAGVKGKRAGRSRKSSSSLTTNYALMLQLYEIAKEEAKPNKQIRFSKPVEKTNRNPIKAAASIITGIVPFLMKAVDFITKETKTGISMVTEFHLK